MTCLSLALNIINIISKYDNYNLGININVVISKVVLFLLILGLLTYFFLSMDSLVLPE